jgi:tRNA modification GTPase
VEHSLESGISKEFFASDIRRALNSLGEITGDVATEDILGVIFSKFITENFLSPPPLPVK